jgi:hypothetical protein
MVTTTGVPDGTRASLTLSFLKILGDRARLSGPVNTKVTNLYNCIYSGLDCSTIYRCYIINSAMNIANVVNHLRSPYTIVTDVKIEIK